MPELSRFYGIIIKLYFDDHAHPTSTREHEVLVRIDTLGVLGGTLPARAMGLVIEWASLHKHELKAAWERAKTLETPEKIAPLP